MVGRHGIYMDPATLSGLFFWLSLVSQVAAAPRGRLVVSPQRRRNGLWNAALIARRLWSVYRLKEEVEGGVSVKHWTAYRISPYPTCPLSSD